MLIENGEVYAPEPPGRCPVLLVGDRVGTVGAVDRRAATALGLDLEVVDATGCVVTPGFIDPHEHVSGGGGEKGFASRTPEIYASEIVTANPARALKLAGKGEPAPGRAADVLVSA